MTNIQKNGGAQLRYETPPVLNPKRNRVKIRKKI